MSTPRKAPPLFHFPPIPVERAHAHYLEATRMVAEARARAEAKAEAAAKAKPPAEPEPAS